MSDPVPRFVIGDRVTWDSYDDLGHFRRRMGHVWNFQRRVCQSRPQNYVYNAYDNKTGVWYHPIEEENLSPVTLIDRLVDAMGASDGS